MSTTIKLIESNSLSYKNLIALVNKQPAKHLKEVPFGNFELELELCDEVYEYAEQVGHCKCYIVTVDQYYAGYMIIMASEMVHHKGTFQAVTDSFYIREEYRSLGAFGVLLKFVEEDLRKNNIRFLTVGLNPNMPHYDRMKRLMTCNDEYQPTEFSVTKEL